MKIKVGELKISEKMIDMRPVDVFTVSRYRIAMRSGAKFPSLKVKAGSLEIVSGYHRHQAYMEEFGADHVIEVEAKKYKDEAEALRDAVRDNIAHGRPMDGITKRRFAIALIEAGDDLVKVAGLLNVPVANLEKWGEMTVRVVGKNKQVRTMPVKGYVDVPGKKMTEAQYKEHMRRDVGMSVVALADQLSEHLENGWFDKDDETVMAAFARLKAALDI